MERTYRVMCQSCEGTGGLWAPKMAVAWGTTEAISLLAPAQCRECRGEGWFDLVELGDAGDGPEAAGEP